MELMTRNKLDPIGVDQSRIVATLRKMGLLRGDDFTVTSLKGGVSSLIVLVEEGDAKFCAKSALAQLKVASDWHAPVHRNQAEVAWMRKASEIVPSSVPQILGEDVEENVFVMQWLDPAHHPVWKQQLMEGVITSTTAQNLGDILGKIHSETAGDAKIANQFKNDADFAALRLEPYLRATANAHPDLSDRILSILTGIENSKHALIHGDVSPKNILIGPKGPIILDAECATYGDPAFDLAFCLNHLILKAVHLPKHRAALAQSYSSLQKAYLAHVTWETVSDLEARTAALLPILALARVDGKSPVEYLAPADQEHVRTNSRNLIMSPASTLDKFLTLWMETLS